MNEIRIVVTPRLGRGLMLPSFTGALQCLSPGVRWDATPFFCPKEVSAHSSLVDHILKPMTPFDPRRFIRNYLFQRFRLGRSTFKRLLRHSISQQQTVKIAGGLFMNLDLGKSNQEFIYWFYEEVEPALQWAINTLMPIGGIMLDCGANTGLMGLLAIHLRQAQSLFIEPLPRLCNTIRTNVALNHFESLARIIEAAASDHEGEADLFLHEKNDGSHSLHWEGVRSCKVKTQRLDLILERESIRRIDLLKVDTEGHDLQVLNGLGNFLVPELTPLLYVETCNNVIRSFLEQRSYRPFQSVKLYIDKLRQTKRDSLFSLRSAAYFFPLQDNCASDILWCGKDSPHFHLLMRIWENSKEVTV